RVLQHMVEEEMNRRRELKKKSRPVSTFSPTPATELAGIHFDRMITWQMDGTTLEFTSVSSPIKLNSGPVTRVSTVQPILPYDASELSRLLAVKQLSLQL